MSYKNYGLYEKDKLYLVHQGTRYILLVTGGVDSIGEYAWKKTYLSKPSSIEVISDTKGFLDEITESLIETTFEMNNKRVYLKEIDQHNLFLENFAGLPLHFRAISNELITVPQEYGGAILKKVATHISTIRTKNWEKQSNLKIEDYATEFE
nr:MAG TPA: hypothetical protein [Caudoviricetes sp.]